MTCISLFDIYNYWYIIQFRLTAKGHIAQDDFCLTLSTEDDVLRDVVNEDTLAKIRSNKKDRKDHLMFYITSQLCIDEGNADLQLWERYRPSLKVINNIKMNWPWRG